MMFPDPVPIYLEGEGHYRITSIKSVVVSQEFARLEEEVTLCQTEEFRLDCRTRKHKERVLEECQCSPASLRSYYGREVTFATRGLPTFFA